MNKLNDFEEEVCGLSPLLQSFSRRFTTDLEDSHDLVQDTVLKALTYKDKFSKETNLKGWLFTIMRNTYINQYRRRQKTQTFSESPPSTLLHLEESYTHNMPQARMEFMEIWENVNDTPTELLIPFKMYTSGYKYEEIAIHLKIPLGTVKNRIFQARKEMQKKLHVYQRGGRHSDTVSTH